MVEALLPGVVDAIGNALVRRVGRATAEDIAQEVAMRAWQHASDFTDAGHLERWCFRVAWNLVTDDWRRRRHFADEPVPDNPSPDDLDRSVQYRLAEAELLGALPRLPPDDQQSFRHLIDWLDGVAPDSPTERRRRFALRQRLKLFLKNYPAAIVWRFRSWLWGRAGSRMRLASLLTVPIVVPVAVSLFGLAEHQLDRPSAAADTGKRPAIVIPVALADSSGRVPALPGPGDDPTRHSRSFAPINRTVVGPPPAVQTLVRYPTPSGKTGNFSLTPNSPAKPLVCASAYAASACLEKPGLGASPPLGGG
jgi:hypothetical protein